MGKFFFSVLHLALFLTLSYNPGKAQSPVPTLQQLKEIFPNEDLIIEKSNIFYSFTINPANQNIEVTERIQHTFRSMKPRVRVALNLFYDSYSEIVSRNQPGSHFKSRFQRVVCGNFEREDAFHHDVKVCRFEMPVEQADQRVTFTAEKKYKDIKYFSFIPLHYEYGTGELTVTLQIPANIVADVHEINLEGLQVTRETFNEQLHNHRIVYTLTNIPPIFKTENLPSTQCFMPHLKIQTRYWQAGGKVHEVMHREENLYNWYISLVSKPSITPAIAELTDRLLTNTVSDDDKLVAMLGWVHSNIRYIAFLDGMAAFVPEAEAEVLKKRYGDCKGTANLLRAMLTHAGFDARLAWVYSGTYCYHDSLLSLAKHNHMICAVKHNDGFILLDPTVKYHSVHEIPAGLHGKSCIIEDDEKGWVQHRIPDAGINENSQHSQTTITLEGDKMRLQGKITLSGTEKVGFVNYLNSLPKHNKDHFIRYFLTELSNRYEIIRVNHTPLDEITTDFSIDYEMLVSNAIISVGNDKIFKVNFGRGINERKIEQERKFTYDTGYERWTSHQISLQVPEGFRIKHLPANVFEDKEVMQFTLQFDENAGNVNIIQKFGVKLPIVQPGQFAQWNSLIDIFSEAFRQMIVITQSATPDTNQ
jgi:hypothetical protein